MSSSSKNGWRANNDITLGELCTELQQQFEITVNEPALCRDNVKKMALHPTDKGSDQVQQLRTQYWETLTDVRIQDLVFIDESGVNLGLMRLFAWAFRGRRAQGEKPKRGKNVSLIAGLSLKGVVDSVCVLGACDGLTYEAFIATRLVPNLWPGAWVILDNCSIHLGEEVRHPIEAAGAHLVYLPPYSPDFSPIENFWSKVKSLLKTMGARSYQALLEAIKIAFNEVSETDIRNLFAHCFCCSP